jgi:hypothetical protein
MRGTQVRKFASYHIPDESFLYVLHAMAEREPNAGRIVGAPDWRMYLMHPEDVERELLRLHQYRKLHYEVAGSLAQLRLPCALPPLVVPLPVLAPGADLFPCGTLRSTSQLLSVQPWPEG